MRRQSSRRNSAWSLVVGDWYLANTACQACHGACRRLTFQQTLRKLAMGSASELEYFLLLARDLEYLAADKYEIAAEDVGRMRRMLNRLMAKVQIERTKAERRTNSSASEPR